MVTVDSAVSGKRFRDNYNQFKYPNGVIPENFRGTFEDKSNKRIREEFSSVSEYVVSLYDAALTWQDLEWLTKITKLPIVVKGILSPEGECDIHFDIPTFLGITRKWYIC